MTSSIVIKRVQLTLNPVKNDHIWRCVGQHFAVMTLIHSYHIEHAYKRQTRVTLNNIPSL